MSGKPFPALSLPRSGLPLLWLQDGETFVSSKGTKANFLFKKKHGALWELFAFWLEWEETDILSGAKSLQSLGTMTVCVVPLKFSFSWKRPASCYPDAPRRDSSAVATPRQLGSQHAYSWPIFSQSKEGKLHRLEKAQPQHFTQLSPFPLMFISIWAEMWQWGVWMCTRRVARASKDSSFNIVPTK